MTSLRDGVVLGAHRLRNRIVAAPMERNYCTPEGHLTDYYRAYLRRFADEGVALVCVEATFVQPDGRGRANQLGMHDDACIPGVVALAQELHARGTLLALELNHAGRTSQRSVTGLPIVAPSPVPCDVTGGGMPRALTHGEILAIVESFAAAARRAARAGVDVLVVHGAHGYLAHQFMSKLHNVRTDEWGEPSRFTDAVIRAVRAAAPNLTLGLRFSAVDGTPGGNTPADQLRIVGALPLELLDFLDVSAGSYESGQWTIQSGEWAPGFLAEHVLPYRGFGLPIGMAGRINSPAVAERLIGDGVADFVSIGRALHADPRWAGAALGHRDDYRPCIACNACIDGLGVGPVVCSVNPEVGRATLPSPAPVSAETPVTVRRPRRRRTSLVVGAGPAGITSALALAAAGREVTVVERADRVGGAMADAAGLRCNPEWATWIGWAERRLRAETDLLLDHAVDGQGDADDWDDIVDARGGVPLRPVIPGADADRVVLLRDWFGRRPVTSADPVLFWGGDAAVLGLADDLASRGAEVTVVAATTELAPELGRRSRILTMPRLQGNPRVWLVMDAVIDAITADDVHITDPQGSRVLSHPGVIVASQGLRRPEPLGRGAVPVGDAAGIPVSTVRHVIAHASDGSAALIARSR